MLIIENTTPTMICNYISLQHATCVSCMFKLIQYLCIMDPKYLLFSQARNIDQIVRNIQIVLAITIYKIILHILTLYNISAGNYLYWPITSIFSLKLIITYFFYLSALRSWQIITVISIDVEYFSLQKIHLQLFF